MSEWTKVKAEDGHELSAYVASPKGEPIGALVLIQEIFGVNAHIRGVADGFARDGFLVIAPALFDRIERGVELKYEGDDAKRGFELMYKADLDKALLDIAAAYAFAKNADRGDWVLFRWIDDLVDGDSRRDSKDAAIVLRWILPRGHWEVCCGGAKLSGDAAYWSG